MTAEPENLHGCVLASARRRGSQTCLRWRDASAPGRRAVATYGELAREVEAFARGLTELGVVPGDRVALISENGPRWIVADLGILAAGGISVPRGTQSPPAEVRAILRHSGASLVILQDVRALESFGPALPEGAPVVVLEGAVPGGSGAHRFDAVVERGAASVAALPEVASDAVATLVYTSGTTGEPKGVILTHANIVSNVRGIEPVLPVRPGERFLALLPSWHMYERTVEYFALFRGAEISYTTLKRLRHDLVEERPHFLASVPRVWESLHDSVRQRVRAHSAPVRALVDIVLGGSLLYRRSANTLRRRTAAAVEQRPGPLARTLAVGGLLAWPLHVAADRLVHRKLREATGGRLAAAISGGGALPPHVDAFMDACDVQVLVGYGLTETSPVVAVRRPERNVLGTIGTPIARTELRIVCPETGAHLPPGRTGVLHVRGAQVMSGYWRNEEATRRVLSEDGWFDTGDLVRLTAEQDLVFCGRAKDTIVLRGGENVEPEPLEQAVLASPLVGQVVVLGQDRKALGALVWPDPEMLLAEGVVEPEGALARVRTEVQRLTGPAGGFRPWERIPHVALLPEPLSTEAGTLTQTLKVRRAEVRTRYTGLIDGELFGDRA